MRNYSNCLLLLSIVAAFDLHSPVTKTFSNDMAIPIMWEVCISTPTVLFCTCMNVVAQRLFLSPEWTLPSELHHRKLCGNVAYTVVRNPVIKNTLCIKCLAIKLPSSTSGCDVFHYYLFYSATFNSHYIQCVPGGMCQTSGGCSLC